MVVIDIGASMMDEPEVQDEIVHSPRRS
jgi:hypothetical protein